MIRTIRLFTVFAASLLVSFCVGHAQRKGKPQGSPAGKDATEAVAIVNGKKVPLARYLELYNDQALQQRKIGYDTAVDLANADAIFRQVVQEELLRQEATKHKIVVTRNQALQALLNDPPDFMRPPFIDDKGVFHEEVFRQVVQNPALFGQLAGTGRDQKQIVERWKEDVEKVIRYVQNEELKRKLGEVLYARTPLTEQQLKYRYLAERTSIMGSFIRVLHSTVPDSLVPVTDEEARAWYDTHQDDYSFASARYVATLILPVSALQTDSLQQHTKLQAARTALAKASPADRPRIMDELSRGLPANRFSTTEAVSLIQLPEVVREQMATATTGDVIGPVDINGDQALLYVEGTGPTADTVLRARHILFKPGDRTQDSLLNLLLIELKQQITTDSAFDAVARMYGQDGTSRRGGDLGYFARGTMVAEFDSACALAPIGTVIGPVKTRFGQHLVMVTERRTTGYKLRELRFPLSVSPEASESVMSDARLWAEALRNPQPHHDSLLAEIKARHSDAIADTSLIRRLDTYGDALTVTDFAFRASPGDVAIVKLPYDRLAVTKLLRSWPAGVAPYSDIKRTYVIPHVQRAKQLDMLRPRMEELRNTLTPEMTLGNIRLSAPMAEVFVVENQTISSPPDEDPGILDSLIAVTQDSSVSGPVRGTHGYYFVRILEKTMRPSEEDYARERQTFVQDYKRRRQEQMLEELLIKASNFAEVVDQRPLSSIVMRQ